MDCTFNRALCYILLILGIVSHDWFCFASGALFLHLITLEGVKGPKGDTGATGFPGAVGMMGPKGDRGMSFDEYHEYNNQFSSRTD